LRLFDLANAAVKDHRPIVLHRSTSLISQIIAHT
jgi:hypothetical protein